MICYLLEFFWQMAQQQQLLHNFLQSIVFTTDEGLLAFWHSICIINTLACSLFSKYYLSQPHHSTRSSSVVSLSHLPSSSSLRISDWSFRYASPRLWNQLPASLRQPRAGLSILDSDLPTHASSAFSLNSPLSSSITPSLFHSQLKTYLFHKSFPP